MAVKMRLRREGKRKQPFYRIVVADVRSPRDGRFIEDLGFYHPIREPSTISIDRERALYWLRNGVQPSEAVANLLRIEGIWEEFRPGEPDPHAERRAKRAEKRSKHQERLDRARAAQDDARRRSEEDKAAADAAQAAEIAQQAAEEVVQPPSSMEPGAEETVVDDTEAAAAAGVEAVEQHRGSEEAPAPAAEEAEPAANEDAGPAEQPKENGS